MPFMVKMLQKFGRDPASESDCNKSKMSKYGKYSHSTVKSLNRKDI